MGICPICRQKKCMQDGRTFQIHIANGYNLSELSSLLEEGADGFYRITTCKDCRGDFLGMLRRWLNGELVLVEDETRRILVRVDGREVRMTEEEAADHRKKLEKEKPTIH